MLPTLPPIELVHHTACMVEQYVLASHVMITHPIEMQGVLIYSHKDAKYLAYILPYNEVTTYPINLSQIVASYTPCLLKDAQRHWPNYNLNDGNYGC